MSKKKSSLTLGDAWLDKNIIFTDSFGDYMRPDSLTSWFKKFVHKYNLPINAHIHTLRHTNASIQIANGVDIATVSGRLGHADKTTTLNTYTHAFQSTNVKAAEKLERIFLPHDESKFL